MSRLQESQLWTELQVRAGGSGRLNVCVISDCVPLALPVLPFAGSTTTEPGTGPSRNAASFSCES